MALEYEYIRGTRDIANTSPYRQAIPNYNELAYKYGMGLGQQQANAERSDLRLSQAEYENSSNRRALNISRGQNTIATALGIVGVGIQGAMTLDKFLKQKEKEAQDILYNEKMMSTVGIFEKMIKDIAGRSYQPYQSIYPMKFAGQPSQPPWNSNFEFNTGGGIR